MAITNRPSRKNYAIGLAPQTAKAATALVTAARFMQALSVRVDPGRQAIHPQGATGSLHMKDTHRNVVQEPKITAQILGSREFLGPLLEMMTFGAPTVAVSQLTEKYDGQLVETADPNSNTSAWVLTGIDIATHTDAGKVYVRITGAGPYTVNLYKASGGGTLDKIATGAGAAGGAVVLAEANSSGVSGSVTLGNPVTPEADDLHYLTLTSMLSVWALTGVRPGFNTEYTVAGVCTIYGAIDTNVIKLYSDAARTALIASGACAAGSVTLTAQNDSGLSGTVTCGSATPDDDADITLTINTISVPFATEPAKYWTLFVLDGNKIRTYTDCVLKSIRGATEQAGPLLLDVEWWAMAETREDIVAETFSIPASTPYAHNGDLAFRRDVAGSPIVESPISLEWTFDRDLQSVVGPAAVPQVIYSRLQQLSVRATFEPGDEADTIAGLQDSFDEIDVKYTVGAKILALVFNKVKVVNPSNSSFSNDDVEQVSFEWLAMEETAAAPTAAVTITYMP